MGVLDGISDNGLTIRQKATNAFKAKIVAMQDGGEDVWRNVYEGDLEDLGNESMPAASLDFGTEEMLNNTFPCSHYRLPTFVHFRFRGQRGLDEHNAYMYYLGLLQYALLGEHNLAGVTLNVVEDSNAHTIVGIEDVYPGGTMFLYIEYKTRLHNPYNLPHEA